ncbi:glucosamine-6-phosphate deaminase [Rhodopirellula sp. MGV]|uniref:glucosamine-6-phosphate deaminase n=1 Tax=Rhodopirellula sp. MGV TaxID=2023130 RepID=UPI000B9772F1|nr:glucosamine-6-phosphate deaminase [Rhodopirellula sp. MGV]OYP35983.1 glucosamine-6-phosphate deaminase [Rhodopirellula sp. MGV]PNY36660.1 glucosamine-6-phosphate deaminase [Rhodopirellula baltica]
MKTFSKRKHAGNFVTPPTSIPYRVFPEARDASEAAALEIATLVRSRAAEGRTCVLGLATGSTVVNVYSALVRMHQEQGLSFANVAVCVLDEFLPMSAESLQSHVRFINEHLLDHVDVPKDRTFIPDGTTEQEQLAEYCVRFEKRIEKLGGIDMLLLGIGRTGHIGFNEPGSGTDSRTRPITLDAITRIDAASNFFGVENVPRRAITMGVGTILDARRIILLAFGEGKASIVARAVEGEVAARVPATFLQQHDDVEFFLDSAAAANLEQFRAPWLVDEVHWDDKLVRRAVIALSQSIEKPVLMLTDTDYNNNGLQSLLAEYGSAYEINLSVFRYLQNTITGWPAGKPNQPNTVFPKRVILFSPHPDDDVISMGGTLTRMADQGHEVHVAYQTSGNLAVFDGDALRFAEFVVDFCEQYDILTEPCRQLTSKMIDALQNKQSGSIDISEVQQLKGLIRRGEAAAGARVCGVRDERLHYLNLPFYETGKVRKNPFGREDIQITVDLLRSIKPHQIYAAGDLSDPHGTHRVCIDIIFAACEVCRHDDWFQSTVIWLYRGAWQEWAPHEIEMAVPLSPQEVDRKRDAIFKHESQKDRALFPGSDAREFWQRAEARNALTANIYDRLGLAQYQAIEGFVRWKGFQQDGDS